MVQVFSLMGRAEKNNASALGPVWREIVYFWSCLAVGLLILTSATGPSHARDLGKDAAHSPLAGLRYGISVTDLNGNVLVAHRADERFVPASNAKLFVTAAALAVEAELSALEPGLQVVSEPTGTGPPSLTLVGRGDPTVGFGADCHVRCIETLAASVAASGITEVGDIVGDDQWFADERRPLGWSWDDLKFGHGTAVSAIAVNDNVLPLRVSPSHTVGTGVRALWVGTGPSYFNLRNDAKTSTADKPRALRLERRIGDRTARLYGELPVGSRAVTLDLAIDNPAHLAVWVFKRALEAKGVSVLGELRTRRRPLQHADEPKTTDPNDPAAQLACGPGTQIVSSDTVIASLPPAPLQEVVAEINQKVRICMLKFSCVNWVTLPERGRLFVDCCRSNSSWKTSGCRAPLTTLLMGRAFPTTIASHPRL